MHHIVGPAEVAAMLGISRQRLHQIETEGDPKHPFPEPTAVLATGRVWETSDIVKWAKATGREVRTG